MLPKSAPIAASPWRTFAYVPGQPFAQRIERDGNGTVRFTMGGVRVEMRGDAITFADEGLLDTIAVSCHSGSGWLHLTTAGHVFWSDTFLGALEPVGTLDYTWGSVQQCGPVVVINHNAGAPDMWTHAGPRPLPVAQEFSHLRFISPTQARAIAPPDRLLQSDDGGQSFYESASKARDFKSPRDWVGKDLLPEEDPVERTTTERLLAAYVHRSVASEAGAEAGGLRLRDGTWTRYLKEVWNDEQRTRYEEYVSIRRPDGTILDTRIHAECKFFPWGNRLLADCGSTDLRVVYPLDGPRIPKPPVLRYHMGPIFVDPAGHYLVADAGPLIGGDHESIERKLLLFDGTEWYVYDHILGSPVAISDKWLLLCGSSCRLVPLWNPEASGVLVAADSKRVSAFQLLDGAMVYLRKKSAGEGQDEKAEFVYREIGPKGLARETTENIAPDAHWLAFAVRLHGILIADPFHGAVDASDPRAYATSDGGKSWMPLDKTAFDYLRPSELYSNSRCWSHGCSIGGAIAFTDRAIEPPATGDFARALPAPHAPLPLTRSASYGEPEAALREALGTDTNHYECTSHPKAPPQALDPRLPEPPAQGSAARSNESIPRWSTNGGVFEKLADSPRFQWRGYDAQGVFSVTTPLLAGKEAALWESIDTWWSSARRTLVTRRFAVIYPEHRSSLGLSILHEDGHMEQLSATSDLWAEGVALSEGTAVVQIRYPDRKLDRDTYVEVLALDAQGRVTARRWFAERPAISLASALMASGPSGPGIVRAEGDVLKFFSLDPGTAPEVFHVPRSIPDCKDVAKGNPLRFFGLYVWVNLDVPQGKKADSHYSSMAEALVEMRDGGACLRGIRARDPFALALNAENGTFRGKLVGPKAAYDVTCTHVKTKGASQ